MQLPLPFIEQTKAILGLEETTKLEEALQQNPLVSIRLNPQKIGNVSLQNKVGWCSSGYYLGERPSFTFDPLFHCGSYYVQEASSMFLEQAIKCFIGEKPVIALDLCAAPGGKSTHLASLLPKNSLLVSNEVIRSRMNVLSENIQKCGTTHALVTNNVPADFKRLPHFFDILLTDVPCSGEGMFRKDSNSIGEWSPSNVKLCSERQRSILLEVWDTLKPGGLLIYSTCTYNTLENEENIQWIMKELGAEALSIPLSPEWNISLIEKYHLPVYRFFPHKTKGEGFSLTLLRKHDGTYSPLSRMKKKIKSNFKIPEEVQKWLLLDYSCQWRENRGNLIASPSSWMDEIQLLEEQLNVNYETVAVASIKGKDWIPQQALALSTQLNRNSFERYEASYEEAISYLRRETLTLPDSLSKGFLLITYKGNSLGFVKNVQGRANNLYPQEWKIRSSYLPETTFTL